MFFYLHARCAHASVAFGFNFFPYRHSHTTSSMSVFTCFDCGHCLPSNAYSPTQLLQSNRACISCARLRETQSRATPKQETFQCARCGELRDRTLFSKTMLGKPAHARVCGTCASSAQGRGGRPKQELLSCSRCGELQDKTRSLAATLQGPRRDSVPNATQDELAALQGQRG